MGKKSNRKYVSRQVRQEAAKKKNKWTLIVYAIILPAVGLFVWSFILVERTFVHNAVVLIATLLGGLMGTAILTVLWRKHSAPFWVLIFYGMATGGSLSTFLLIAPNYYFRDGQTVKEQIEIVGAGNRSKRNSDCQTPYAVIVYDEIKKELPFPCDYEKNIFNFKTLRLEVSEGLWGFNVIEDKDLVP